MSKETLDAFKGLVSYLSLAQQMRESELRWPGPGPFRKVSENPDKKIGDTILSSMETEETKIIREYFRNPDHEHFYIKDMQVIRDGGTIEILTDRGTRFWLSKDRKSFHNAYPATDVMESSKITDKSLVDFIVLKLIKYIEDMEKQAYYNRTIISKTIENLIPSTETKL